METISRTAAAVPIYFKNLLLEDRRHFWPTSLYFFCMIGACRRSVFTSAGSVKLPVSSIPVSSIVPLKKVEYSAMLSKQKTSPGLQTRYRELQSTRSKGKIHLVRLPTPRGSQLTTSYTPPVTPRSSSLSSVTPSRPEPPGPPIMACVSVSF